MELPLLIVTAYSYVNGTDRYRGPTRVVPGSWRSGRQPGDEDSFGGNEARVVLAQPGDMLLFRSDVWHSASVNLTDGTARLVVETNFGASKVAGGAYGGGGPYRHLALSAATEEAATDGQLRVLGKPPRGQA